MRTRIFALRLLASGCGLLALSGGTLAQGPGAAIRGRVDVRLSVPAVERRPNVNELGMHATHEPPAGGSQLPAGSSPLRAQSSVVYLESAPSLAFPEVDRQRMSMDQRNETFVPRVLAITVGTTVDFPNSDGVYHNVFSLSGAKRFDLGRYPAGRSRSVRFDRPGIVRVFCEIHPHMSAFILVFNHRYFAVTGADGRYQINRVPAGRYTLVAWHEGSIRESRAVVVPEDASSVEVDFTVR